MLLVTLLLFLLFLAGSVADTKDSNIVEKTLAGMTWDDLIGQMAQIDLSVLLNENGTALVQSQLDHYIGELGVGSVLNNVAKGDKIWTIADFRAAAVQIQQTAKKYKKTTCDLGARQCTWGELFVQYNHYSTAYQLGRNF